MTIQELNKKIAALKRKRYNTFVAEQEVSMMMNETCFDDKGAVSHVAMGLRYATGLAARAKRLDAQIQNLQGELASRQTVA